MKPQTDEARYQLTLLNYPNAGVIPKICKLIYQVEDKNLLASLNTLPYVVGRSFSKDESESLHLALKELKIGHRFLSNDGPPLLFDPTQTTEKKVKEPSAKVLPFKRKDRLKSRKLIIGVFASLLVIVGIWIFVANSRQTKVLPSIENENFEAKIESLIRDVEYRVAEGFLWKKAAVNLSLQPQDSIRTFQESLAYLRYREGNRVTVFPNTLMVIGKRESSERKLIKLQDGSLQARMKSYGKAPASID